MEQSALLTVLAGCPNTGKTTLFNGLTGQDALTGCWAGTTVCPAIGGYAYRGQPWLLADLPSSGSLGMGPGLDSLTGGLLSSGLSGAILVSCSALALEQGLSFLKRLTEARRMEAAPLPILLCLTFWDEAVSQGLSIDRQLLEDVLQIPVLPFSPGSPELLDDIREALYHVCRQRPPQPFAYGCLDFSPARLAEAAAGGKTALPSYSSAFSLSEKLAASPLSSAVLMALLSGMAAAAALLFALPASWLLFQAADGLTQPIFALLQGIGPGKRLADCVCQALWRPFAVSLSLFVPAGVILFFLGGLIKDSGLLPRAALVLDPLCRRCGLCPEAAMALLTGLGSRLHGICACGWLLTVSSRRAALLSLSFIPDAGCLPLAAAVGILFFSQCPIRLGLIFAALALTCLGLGLLCSLFSSRIRPRGPRPFSALALPALRRPDPLSACSFSLRSCLAPALKRLLLTLLPLGVMLWLAARLPCPGPLSQAAAPESARALSLLDFILNLLEPLGAALGMDGAILLAFLLSFSCSEAAAPLLFAVYLIAGEAQMPGDFWELRQFLEAQGWNQGTALCVLLFNALHWPCLSALKIARSWDRSRLRLLLSILLPALFGGLLCAGAACLTALLRP